MTLGQALSSLPAEERAKEVRLKAAVNGGATEIAEEYLNEIAPYIGESTCLGCSGCCRGTS